MVLSLALASARTTAAQPSPYCARVRARTASEADLLMTPRVVLQGVRFPRSGQIDIGPVTGNGFQARAGLLFSPLDFYKGLGVLRAGEIDCEQHEAKLEVEDWLEHGTDAARLAARRAQIRYLEAHRAEWRAIAERAAERLSEHAITLAEYDSLRQRIEGLDQKLLRARGDASRFEASGVRASRESVAAMADRFLRTSLEFERETSRVRLLDAWHFQLSGGVIPQDPVDWYGLAELSFSLGGLARPREEERSIQARADELKSAPYEAIGRLDRLRAQEKALVEQTRDELDVVRREIAVIASTRKILERAVAENIEFAKDTLSSEQLSAEAEEVYLQGLVESLIAHWEP